MQHILSSTLPIFLITLLGSIIKRKWLTSDEFWRGLEKLSYFLLFPAMLFNYISTADFTTGILIKLVFALIVATSIVSAILIIYQKHTDYDPIQFTSVFQGGIRYNTYIFFGLSGVLFGNEGLAIVAVISSYMIIFTNVLSVMVFAIYIPTISDDRPSNKGFKMLLKMLASNPLIIASIVGVIFNYSEMQLNLGLRNTISSLSSSALAIGMLNVGAGLKFAMDGMQFRQIIFASGIKLILLPIVTVCVLSIFAISGMPRAVGVLYSCLPCASTAFVLSRQLGGDPESMASIVTFTTIFSVITLSIMMYILT
jgi:malonate transporter